MTKVSELRQTKRANEIRSQALKIMKEKNLSEKDILKLKMQGIELYSNKIEAKIDELEEELDSLSDEEVDKIFAQ